LWNEVERSQRPPFFPFDGPFYAFSFGASARSIRRGQIRQAEAQGPKAAFFEELTSVHFPCLNPELTISPGFPY
jgi:hypothetical protein